MTQQTSLKALADRLRKATGQLDDELLGQALCAVHGWEFGTVSISCGDDGSAQFELYSPRYDRLYGEYRHRCPDISLDATLELVSAKLPGWGFVVGQTRPGDFTANVENGTLVEAESDWRVFTANGATPALALLAALLTALAEQEG